MLTKLSIGAAILSLLLASIWPASFALPQVARLAVCTAAVVAALQASEMGRYLWLWGFVAIGVLFNPMVPVDVSRLGSLGLSTACAAAFLTWLMVVQHNVPPQSVEQVLHPSRR